MPKNVLILANNDVGLYRFRKELLKRLVSDYKVYICLPYGEFVEKLKEYGVKYVDCSVYLDRRGTNPVKDLKLMGFYKKLIRSISPDVVLTYTIKPNVYGGMVCSKLKVPYIANVTGLGTAVENEGVMQKLVLSLYKKGFRGAQKVFFQNKDNLEYMISRGIVKRDYDILPGSGVNTQEHFYEPYLDVTEGVRFLFVGRLMRDKGILEYIRAARIIKDKYKNATFSIVGDYDEETLKDKIKDYEAHGIVKCFGQQDDMHSIYKEHHVLVLPTYHEGMSNVLQEAASTGRAVIASDIPGCREIFEEEKTGFGCKVKDVDSLAMAMERFINLSFKEQEAMGKAGREKMIREFDRQIVIDKYMNAIRHIE